jgi:hypothetical protein
LFILPASLKSISLLDFLPEEKKVENERERMRVCVRARAPFSTFKTYIHERTFCRDTLYVLEECNTRWLSCENFRNFRSHEDD